MKITDIRRLRLAQLIASYGTQAKFVEAKELNQGEISSLLKNKSFGEKKARKLELQCGLEEGWLDTIEISPATGDAQVTPESSDKKMLTYVTYEEMLLLTDFREATPTGHKLIADTAKSVEKSPAVLTSVFTRNQS